MDIQALAKQRDELLQWLRQITGCKDLRSVTELMAVCSESTPGTPEQILQELPALQQLVLDGSQLLSLAACCYCRLLTHLSVASCQLEDLEGLQGCQALQQLHAPHNTISDLAPLAGLNCLAVLDLSHNRVGDPDMLTYLTECPALVALDLRHNPAGLSQQQVTAVLPQLLHYGLSHDPDHLGGGQQQASGPRSAQQQQPRGSSIADVGLYWRKLRVGALADQPLQELLVVEAAATAAAGAGSDSSTRAGAVEQDHQVQDSSSSSSSALTHGAGAVSLGGSAARGLRRRQQQQQQGQVGGATGDTPAGSIISGVQQAAVAAACQGGEANVACSPAEGDSLQTSVADAAEEEAATELPTAAGRRSGASAVANPLLKASQAAGSRGTSALSSSSSRPATASSILLHGRPSTSASTSSSSSVLSTPGVSWFGLSQRGAGSSSSSFSRSASQQAVLLLQQAELLNLTHQDSCSTPELGCVMPLLRQGTDPAAGPGGGGVQRPSTSGSWDQQQQQLGRYASCNPLAGSSRGSQSGSIGGGEDSLIAACGPLSRSSSSSSGLGSRLSSARRTTPGLSGLQGSRSSEPAVASSTAGWVGKQEGMSMEQQEQEVAGGVVAAQGRLQLPRIGSASRVRPGSNRCGQGCEESPMLR